MAAVAKKDTGKDVKQYNYSWTGKDKSGKVIKGELRAGGENIVVAQLRRQGFDIVGRGHSNPSVAKLLMDIKTDVETGSSLGQAFRKHPKYFDALFCNLVAAGEAAGILDALLDRLATYKEKILAIKGKITSALFYPIAVIVVALVVTAVIMIFVIPVFKDLF